MCATFRGCSHIMSVKIRGSWTPPPPLVSFCQQSWGFSIYHTSTINDVNSYKKNHRNGQFLWLPIDFQWQWSKRYPNYANTSAFFSDWNIFKKVSSQGIPCLSWHPELSRYVIVGHVVHVGHLLPLHVGQHVHLHVGHFFCQLPCWLPCQPTCRPPQCRLAAFGDADRMEICV